MEHRPSRLEHLAVVVVFVVVVFVVVILLLLPSVVVLHPNLHGTLSKKGSYQAPFEEISFGC